MQAPSSSRFPLQIRPTWGRGGSATQIRSLISEGIRVADPPHPRVGRICNGNRGLDGACKKRARFHPHKIYGFSVHCDPWDPCPLFFRKRNKQSFKTCSIPPGMLNVFIIPTSRKQIISYLHKLRYSARNTTLFSSMNLMEFYHFFATPC